jgi:hypothetical protein
MPIDAFVGRGDRCPSTRRRASRISWSVGRPCCASHSAMAERRRHRDTLVRPEAEALVVILVVSAGMPSMARSRRGVWLRSTWAGSPERQGSARREIQDATTVFCWRHRSRCDRFLYGLRPLRIPLQRRCGGYRAYPRDHVRRVGGRHARDLLLRQPDSATAADHREPRGRGRRRNPINRFRSETTTDRFPRTCTQGGHSGRGARSRRPTSRPSRPPPAPRASGNPPNGSTLPRQRRDARRHAEHQVLEDPGLAHEKGARGSRSARRDEIEGTLTAIDT